MSWPKVRLDAVADLCLGKMLDKKKNKGNLRPYLANINVRWGTVDLNDLREMRFEDRELDRYGLCSGDIIMCEGGEPGRCILWKDQVPGMMIQKALHRIRPLDEVTSEFLFYSLFHMGRSGQLEQHFTGATIKHLPGERLARVELRVPPLETQKRIAAILGAYDDLIEINRRRVALLEEMARGLFEEWFVRFRFPGHEDVPIVDTPNGSLPEGWEWSALGASCSIIRSGSTPSRKQSEFWENGTLDWFTTGELKGSFLFSSKEKVSQAAVEQKKARVFPSGTVFIALYGATIGALGISNVTCSSNQAALGIVGDGKRMRQWQLFHTLERLKDWFISVGQGAAQQNISKEKVEGAQVALPTAIISELFDRRVAAHWEMRKSLEWQESLLRASRDLLLPRLISGQLSLQAAERQLEDAA